MGEGGNAVLAEGLRRSVSAIQSHWANPKTWNFG
jgi:hypothetical protein